VYQELLAEGEDVDAEEDGWYLRRLDAGLFTLQNVDYILAWVSMEDDGVSITTLCRCLHVD
jgi:beta-catenin-like protein 1